MAEAIGLIQADEDSGSEPEWEPDAETSDDEASETPPPPLVLTPPSPVRPRPASQPAPGRGGHRCHLDM